MREAAAGYSLAFVDVTDLKKYRADYGMKAFPSVQTHQGMLLAATTDGVIKEGTFPAQYMALIEWPDIKASKLFFSDPDYTPLISVRQKLGESHIGLFSGLVEQRKVQKAAVYMIAFVDVKNVARYEEEYVQYGLKFIQKHGGKILAAADTYETREGKLPTGRIAIAEFPDMQSAEAFYNDPGYQPLIKVRQNLGKTQLGFFPGTAQRN